MQHRSASPTRPSAPSRRARAVGLLAAGLSVAALAGCGSSGDDGAKEKPAELCSAVERYVEATRAGDRTDSADALASAVDGLPKDDRRYVEAYVLALRGAPANFPLPDEDGVSYGRTQTSFHDYVTERCGEDALSSSETTTTAGGDASTTVAGDQGSGSGGTTGVKGEDDQTDQVGGSGSSGSSGSDGSGSGSGSTSGSGGSMTDSDSGNGGTGTGSGSGTDDGGAQSGDTTGPTG
jgi:hypothetical protein